MTEQTGHGRTGAEQTGYVCTVSSDEIPDRAEQIRALTRGLLSRERQQRQVRLRFEPALADVLAAFVRDEARCCTFYDFDLEQTDEVVGLRVSAPAGAEPLLDRLYEVFDPDGDPADPARAAGRSPDHPDGRQATGSQP